MKRMQKLIVILLALCLILSVGIFVACEEVHEHSFDGDYDGDLNNHWRTCSCGAVGPKEAHVDADEDCKCDVCGKDVPHVHKFDDWKSDDISHWKLCTWDNHEDKETMEDHIDSDNNRSCDVCGHHMHVGTETGNDGDNHWKYCPDDETVIGDPEAHKDDNKDGKCDVCEYQMHVHNYTESTSNDSQHWNYCPDDNEIDESSRANHVDSDLNGKCDDCGHDVHVHSYTKTDFDDSQHWKCCPDDNEMDESTKADHVDSDWDEKCDVCGADVLADHQHILTTVINNCTNPSEDKDGSATLTCTEEGCEYNKKISLKYLNAGEAVSVKANPDEDVYFYARKDGWSIYIPSEATMTIGETTSLEYVLSASFDDEYKFIVSYMGAEIEAGTASLGDVRVVLFKASATDGNISFKMDWGPGVTPGTAIALNKNTDYTGEIGDDVTYFKYTATQDEEIVLFNPNGGDNILADGGYAQYKYNIYSLSAGESLAISITSGDYSFKLIDKEEGKSYEGWTPSTAIDVEGNTLQSSGEAIGTKYYKITATQAGRISLSFSCEGGNVSYIIGDVSYGYFSDNFAGAPYLAVGDVAYVAVSCSSDDVNISYSASISYTALSAVDNNFIVKDVDGNPVANVTVSLKDSDGSVAYSGVTNAEGKVVLNYIPAVYTIELSGFDADVYSYNSTSTKWDADDPATDVGQNYELKLIKSVSKTIIVKVGDSGVAGVKVNITTNSSNGTVITSGVTDADGKLTISYLPAAQGTRYRVVLNDLPQQYYVSEGTIRFYTTDLEDLTINLSEKSAYTVNVIAPEGVDISVEGLKVVIGYFGQESASALTDATGKAVLYVQYNRDFDVSIQGLPYNVEGSGVLAEGTYSVDITLKAVTLPTLSVGDNSLSFDWDAENYGWEELKYAFVSEEGGSYTMTFKDDANKSVYAYTTDFYSPILSGSSYDTISEFKFTLSAGEGIVIIFTSNTYDDVTSCSYTIVIAENAPAPSGNSLAMGDNNVTATYDEESDWWGFFDYVFTSAEGGNFVITFGANHGFGAVYLPGNLYEPVLAYSEYEEEGIFSYTFSLKAGESITFKISSVGEYDEESFASDSFTINIAESAAPAPVTVLSFGDNLVAATYQGNALTFTSEEGGQFILSSEDDNFLVFLMDDTEITEDYSFELEAGESITFLFSTADYSASDQYVVNIDNGMAK